VNKSNYMKMGKATFATLTYIMEDKLQANEQAGKWAGRRLNAEASR